jgi:hypothetical protein
VTAQSARCSPGTSRSITQADRLTIEGAAVLGAPAFGHGSDPTASQQWPQEVAAFFRCSSAQETVEILEWPALLLIFGLSKARRRSIPFDGSVTEEQRRSGQKAAQRFGRKQFEASGCVARSFQVAMDMRLARALPSAPTCFRADHPSISTVSWGGENAGSPDC